MNKQQLASRIWEAANKMRSKIEANEYKDYILGFIFYKFLSDKEIMLAKKEGWSDDDLKHLDENDTETAEWFQNKIGYFISYDNLFSTWLNKGKNFDVSNVRDALSAFGRLIDKKHSKVFDRIFNTLETGLSKLGDSSGAQTKAISELIQLIKVIPMDSRQDYDVLGFIYEYLISMFASNAGKKAGEFYTPHEVSLLMSEIVAEHLKDREKIKIYDPTSGSGSLLINIGRSVSMRIAGRDNIKYYAQELKENTYNLTRMNLIMRGILPHNIVTRCGDTLEEDWPYFDESDPQKTYDPLYVDAVVSNPPYSQSWEPTDKESDPRYKRFGLAPKSKADYAFLLHDLFHIKPDGIMTIVLPHGVLFRGGEEETIRMNLIENNHIDTVIGLPANIFFGTGIPTIIMVLKQKRENTDVLIIDASKGFEKAGTSNKLRACDIKKIADTVSIRKDIPNYSKKVSRDTIRENLYNLNIPRYIDSSEKAENWDIYASIFGGIPSGEIDDLNEYWQAFPTLKYEIFEKLQSGYFTLNVKETKDIILKNKDVSLFKERYISVFSGFENMLVDILIRQMQSIDIAKQETVIANDIFNRLKDIPLVDKYHAYQLLNDTFIETTIDLEIIQTEGFDAVKKVEPKMVTKKEKGKEIEVQEGIIGKILPFDLVQDIMLTDEKDILKQKEDKLQQVVSDYNDVFESLTEEDKEELKDCINEAGTSFVNSAIGKEAKSLQKKAYDDDSIVQKIIVVNKLILQEKTLKSDIKLLSQQLEEATKQTIESLSDEEAKTLLKHKWITPIIDALYTIPKTIVSELEKQINTLTNKYSVTLLDVESQIRESEQSFSNLIDELVGSASDIDGLKQLQALLRGEK